MGWAGKEVEREEALGSGDKPVNQTAVWLKELKPIVPST
jgi:hypothetical protein